MPEKTEVLTGPQIQFEYFVALNKVEAIEKEAAATEDPDYKAWLFFRIGEIRSWMDMLKGEYIGRGENPGDIPF